MSRQVIRVLYVCTGCGESFFYYLKPRRIVQAIVKHPACGSVASYRDHRVTSVGKPTRLAHA